MTVAEKAVAGGRRRWRWRGEGLLPAEPTMLDTHASSSPQRLRAIDPPCDAFERAWQQGRRPALEHYLGEVDEPLSPLLVSELIRIELEWRCRHGEAPSSAEYAGRS